MGCFFKELGSGEFWTALLNTFLRTLLAFAISLIGAGICAVFAHFCKFVKGAMKPVMAVLRTLPTMAVILIILKMTCGNRALSPVIVTVLVLLPLIYTRINASFENLGEDVEDMAKVYRIGFRDRLFKMYLPVALDGTLSSFGADISLGLKVMISAEVLASTSKGLGGMMQLSSVAAETATLAALTLAAVVIGLIVDFAFSQLSRITKKWSAKEGGK